MLWNQEIAEWKVAYKVGCLYYKGQRIQLHISKLPIPHNKDYTNHVIQFDTDDISFEVIERKGRKQRIRTLSKVLNVFPPKK